MSFARRNVWKYENEINAGAYIAVESGSLVKENVECLLFSFESKLRYQTELTKMTNVEYLITANR